MHFLTNLNPTSFSSTADEKYTFISLVTNNYQIFIISLKLQQQLILNLFMFNTEIIYTNNIEYVKRATYFQLVSESGNNKSTRGRKKKLHS